MPVRSFGGDNASSFPEFVKRPRTFLGGSGAVLLLSLGFQLTRPLVGGLLLDEVAESAAVLSMLSAMSFEQMAWHIAVTAGFDFLYPWLTSYCLQA
ncbi:MAG: hypothetical protein CM15mP120_01230 [Pseudomonadota bacterium]|nr:MAG: hypothetical protein CM15mP120_01230 [Pseudomonadota bacterium]